MAKPAAFYGSYVDAKFMRGLKVTRVMIDIPIESTNAFLLAFGAPDGVNPVPVAIARLVEGAYAPKETGSGSAEHSGDGVSASSSLAGTTAVEPEGQSKARQYTRSQIAAMKCSEVPFQWWLMKDVRPQDGRCWPRDDMSANAKADLVLKEHLGIQSKKELDSDGPKAVAFDRLMTDYDTRGLRR